ncbi:MAG: hypothetical protein AAFR68_07405 [Pseudomonadota bacterium]
MKKVRVISSFRRFQAISDLSQLATAGGAAAYRTIAESIPADIDETIEMTAQLQDAARFGQALKQEVGDELYPRLLFAATQPQPNRAAFRTATALLLIDRLLDGYSEDGLEDYWDAFVETYRGEPGPVRAAIVQGYLAAASRGLCDLDPLPEVEDGLTRDGRDVLTSVRATVTIPDSKAEGARQCLIHALPAQDQAGVAEQFWRRNGFSLIGLDRAVGSALWAGFRYLYEVDQKWDPFGAGARGPLIAIPMGLY